MDDLRFLKKHYGEKFMQYCRNNFATILQEEGVMTKLITSCFAETHSLFDDLSGLEVEFKDYLLSEYDNLKQNTNKKLSTDVKDSPKQLMAKAGYHLFDECKSESDIQAFRHFYKRDDSEDVSYEEGSLPKEYNGEELCTFSGGRLYECRVFFATKNNVDEIRRIDYPLPGEDFRTIGGRAFVDVKDEYARRIDKEKSWDDLSNNQKRVALRDNPYGTSVISIQISKLGRETVSIKNRYNHHLPFDTNPDATFGNDLDNISTGLTESFNKFFGCQIEKFDLMTFPLPRYVISDDGRRYRYNQEINGVYYCENNVVINQGKVFSFDPERYIVMDNGQIIDFKEKVVFPYKDSRFGDSLFSTLPQNCNITVSLNKKTKEKVVCFSKNGQEDINLTFDKHNCLIEIQDPNLVNAPDEYCEYCSNVKHAKFDKLVRMGSNCFLNAEKL